MYDLLVRQRLPVPRPGRAGSSVTEAAGSHAIYVSQPAAVADLITQAATAEKE
ncbi:MAG: hypothetical protein ACRDP6_45575 [Actinoallomurus sp.]